MCQCRLGLLNSIFLTAAMLVSAGLLAAGLDVFGLFLLIAGLNMLVVVRSAQLLPELPNRTIAAVLSITG